MKTAVALDETYHYPPELLTLLVDALSVLCRSKPDVLTFLRGAGVPQSFLRDLEQRVATDRSAIRKHEIARTVLVRLNEAGESMLRQRREIVKRVTETESFATCWPADVHKAKGLVAEVREIVNVKDSFTPMRLEREHERAEAKRARARPKPSPPRRRGWIGRQFEGSSPCCSRSTIPRSADGSSKPSSTGCSPSMASRCGNRSP